MFFWLNESSTCRASDPRSLASSRMKAPNCIRGCGGDKRDTKRSCNWYYDRSRERDRGRNNSFVTTLIISLFSYFSSFTPTLPSPSSSPSSSPLLLLSGQDQPHKNLSCGPWDRTGRHLPGCRSIAKTSTWQFSSLHTQMPSRWTRICHQLKAILFSNTPNGCFSKILERKYIPENSKKV